MWVATSKTRVDQKLFFEFTFNVFKFVNETPDMMPLIDWYDTRAGCVVSFVARPVVGGIWAKYLL